MTDPNTRTASPKRNTWTPRQHAMNALFGGPNYTFAGQETDTFKITFDTLEKAFTTALASPPSTADAPAASVEGFAHAEYRDTAALLRSDEAARARVASNRHNVILAALDYLANQSADAPSPAPAPQAEKAPAIDLAAYFERVLSAAIEGAKVAEVCARLATEYGRRGDVQIANGHSAPAHRTSKAYEQHLERIASALENITSLRATATADPVRGEGDGT